MLTPSATPSTMKQVLEDAVLQALLADYNQTIQQDSADFEKRYTFLKASKKYQRKQLECAQINWDIGCTKQESSPPASNCTSQCSTESGSLSRLNKKVCFDNDIKVSETTTEEPQKISFRKAMQLTLQNAFRTI